MIDNDFTKRAYAVLENANGRRLFHVAGPNASHIEFWAVGGNVIVLQFYKDGGFSHWLPPKDGRTWSNFTEDVQSLVP